MPQAAADERVEEHDRPSRLGSGGRVGTLLQDALAVPGVRLDLLAPTTVQEQLAALGAAGGPLGLVDPPGRRARHQAGGGGHGVALPCVEPVIVARERERLDRADRDCQQGELDAPAGSGHVDG